MAEPGGGKQYDPLGVPLGVLKPRLRKRCAPYHLGANPVGAVTFLFTDIEGSTRRWEADSDGMRVELAAHGQVPALAD